MSNRTATIIGVTGLIGGHLYELLKYDPQFDTIRLLVRRPFEHANAKTEAKLIDFSDWESYWLGINESSVVFCTIGTTQKKVARDKSAYRKVDFDLAVKAAQLCKEVGCPQFILISSAGANAQSKNFYLRLKGEVEDAVRAVGLPSVAVLRPSMLLGKRKEKRTGEKIMQRFMQAFSFLIPKKYQAIEAADVAKAMVVLAGKQKPGFATYENEAIKDLAKTYIASTSGVM